MWICASFPEHSNEVQTTKDHIKSDETLSFMMAAYLTIIRTDAFAPHFGFHDNMIRCDIDEFNASLGEGLRDPHGHFRSNKSDSSPQQCREIRKTDQPST